jgi:glycosyltransferase involved in cell wall biosynthesis
VRYLLGLTRRALAHHARLIHSHLLGSNVYSALVGALVNIPVIAVFHGATDLDGGGRFDRVKCRILLQRRIRIVAVSAGMRDALVHFGIPRERITIIYNGIDTDEYAPGPASPLREELGLGPTDVLIGAVGNLRAPKAYDLLLRAIAQLKSRDRVQVAIFGHAYEEELTPLLQLRQELGLAARVHFLGFRPATPELYRGFDLFVSSSRSEGLPLSFLEAMAVGLPVVATPTSGAHEVIETERTGLVAAEISPEALACVLERALQDLPLRDNLGRAAREAVVHRFSRQTMLEAYGRLYTELAEV